MGYRKQPNGVYPGITAATVQDYVNDYTANDHNTIVADTRNFAQQFGSYGYGNGEDGKFLIGSITNPVATLLPTLQDGGAGEITGTAQYRYRMYNFSGVTAPTNISASLAVTAKRILVTIPAQPSGTNTTGYKLERTTDAGSTWFHVADVPVNDVTQSVTVEDNNPITSGTDLGASNTTSATATVSGIYRVSSLTLTSGQTVNLDTANTLGNKLGLIILCSGIVDIQSGATINGNGAGGIGNSVLGTGTSWTPAYGGTTGGYNATGGTGVGYVANSEIATGELIFGTPNFGWFGAQGAGGITYSSTYQAGGTIYIAAQTQLNVQGTITANGATASAAGAAGGLIALVSQFINRSGGTLTANGATGTSNNGSGGGGIIAFIYNFLKGTSTNTANGGSAPGGSGGSGGGGFGGRGGDASGAGSVGFIIAKTLNKAILPRF